MFQFEGEVNDNSFKQITADLEQKTLHNKKLFKISFELLQNIASYGERRSAKFSIEDHSANYLVTAESILNNVSIQALELKLNHIVSLSKEELDTLYQEVIQIPSVSNQQGAGLGLIDIARKSDEKLRWSFTPIDPQYSFFCIFITCKK